MSVNYYDKENKVKLYDGRTVIIKNTPNTFMSNGSYEVVEWLDNGIGEHGGYFWVKPEDITYEIKTEFIDDINNYFEIIYDENGVNLIPKKIDLISILEDDDKQKQIVLNFPDNKHKKLNIYVGDVVVEDLQKVCLRKKKKDGDKR